MEVTRLHPELGSSALDLGEADASQGTTSSLLLLHDVSLSLSLLYVLLLPWPILPPSSFLLLGPPKLNPTYLSSASY